MLLRNLWQVLGLTPRYVVILVSNVHVLFVEGLSLHPKPQPPVPNLLAPPSITSSTYPRPNNWSMDGEWLKGWKRQNGLINSHKIL